MTERAVVVKVAVAREADMVAVAMGAEKVGAATAVAAMEEAVRAAVRVVATEAVVRAAVRAALESALHNRSNLYQEGTASRIRTVLGRSQALRLHIPHC